MSRLTTLPARDGVQVLMLDAAERRNALDLATMQDLVARPSGVPLGDALERERARGRGLAVDADAVAARRAAVIERARRQL